MEEKQFKKIFKDQTKELKEFTANQFQKYSKELKVDYVRQGKFLLDEFKHQTSVVAEQYTGLNKKVDSMGNKLNATFEEVGKLRVDVEKVKEDVSQNSTDIGIIKEDVQIIKNGLKRKVDLEEFEFLEKRVILLEKKFQSV